MAGPAVNILLRVDSSKVKDDLDKTRGAVQSAVANVATQFFAAEKVVEAFKKSIELSTQALVFLTERTGAVQSLTATLTDTRKALGEAADRSGALRKATEAIEDAARDLATYFRSAEGREAVNGFFGAIATGAANAIDAVNGASKVWQDVKFELSRLGAAGTENMALPLDGETPEQAARTALADRLRQAGRTSQPGSDVRERGTFRDDEAIRAAQKRADELRKIEEARIKSSYEMMDSAVAQFREIQSRERADAMRALDSKRELADLDRKVEEGKTATFLSNATLRAELQEKEITAQKGRDERQAQAAESSAATLVNFAQIATQGVANAIVAGASVIANGGDLGAAIAQAMGGAVAALGATLIATGTGVLAGAALASVVPGLAALFPPWSTGAALGAIAAGTLLVGGGGLIQSLANGGSASPGASGARAPAPGGARGSGFRGTPEGFQTTAPAAQTTILNYNFNGPMGGSPRRIAREIRDLSTAGDTLLPGYRLPGGR